MLISPVKYAVGTLSMRRQSPNVYIPVRQLCQIAIKGLSLGNSGVCSAKWILLVLQFAKVALWNILRRRKRARPAKMLSTSRIHCNTSASTEQCKTSSTSWCRIYREVSTQMISNTQLRCLWGWELCDSRIHTVVRRVNCPKCRNTKHRIKSWPGGYLGYLRWR